VTSDPTHGPVGVRDRENAESTAIPPDLRHEDFSLLLYQSTHNMGGNDRGAKRKTAWYEYLQSWLSECARVEPA
jgi:hypothetical protein